MADVNVRKAWVLLLNYLVVAIAILVSVFVVVSTMLFPGALFDFAGGWQGLKLIFMVDISLAVLFLLAIFRPKKPLPLLRKDLLIVAALQLSILAGGVFMLYWARPLAVVHVFNEFHVINRENFNNAELEVPTLAQFSGNSPKMVWVATEDSEAAFLAGAFLSGLNGKTASNLRVDEYKALPATEAELKIIVRLKQIKSDDCWRVNISSNYESGSVCYNWPEQKFSDFSEELVKPSEAADVSQQSPEPIRRAAASED
jgi:hypothetical protein